MWKRTKILSTSCDGPLRVNITGKKISGRKVVYKNTKKYETNHIVVKPLKLMPRNTHNLKKKKITMDHLARIHSICDFKHIGQNKLRPTS